MGRGAHKIALDTHTPSSSPPCSTSALASMEDCDLADGAADSDPSETLCCKFHKQIDSSPLGSSETEQSLPHLDLPQPQKQVKNQKNSTKTHMGVYIFSLLILPGIPGRLRFFLAVGFGG